MDTTSSTKEIEGYKVNHFGNIAKEKFSKMTTEEKAKYFEAKQKLRDEGVVFPKFEFDAEKKIEELESNIKELEASTNGESVTSANGESVTSGNGESKPKASKTGKADVMNMSYKEVLEQIPDEKQRKKLVNYVKAKLDASKHWFRGVLAVNQS